MSETGESPDVVEERKNRQAFAKGHFLPTSPIMKIPLTSEIGASNKGRKGGAKNQSSTASGERDKHQTLQQRLTAEMKGEFEAELAQVFRRGVTNATNKSTSKRNQTKNAT